MNKYEREILECVAGESPWPQWGAWVGATLSFLREDGYITSEGQPEITEKGRKALETTNE